MKPLYLLGVELDTLHRKPFLYITIKKGFTSALAYDIETVIL